MTDHLPYDHEEFHSDFDLWSDNHVKPGYLASRSVRPYPRNPIKRWLFNVLGIRYAEPAIKEGSVLYWDGNVLRASKSEYNPPVSIAVSDTRYSEHGYFSFKLQPGTVLKKTDGHIIGVVNEKGQIEIGGKNEPD